QLKAIVFHRKDQHFLNFPLDYVMNGRRRPSKEIILDKNLRLMFQQLWLTLLTSSHQTLIYLKMKGELFDWNCDQVPFDLPALKYLILENTTSKQMVDILRHTPNLRSCHAALKDQLSNHLTNKMFFS
ncbi:unnamed protein product, partial [Adineta ricciae]